jgi:hypoxanthine phosphoribosyltransferase
VSRPRLKRVISREQIALRIRTMGREIGGALSPDDRPLAVVVLQGAFVFAADLLRQVPDELGVEVGFLRCDSYGSGMRSKGRVMLLQDLDSELDLRGRTILLIDDILDSGLTLGFLVAHLKARGAERVQICVLLRRKHRKGAPAPKVNAAFVGFHVGPGFFVGYGLDHAGRHRNLPDLAVLLQR